MWPLIFMERPLLSPSNGTGGPLLSDAEVRARMRGRPVLWGTLEWGTVRKRPRGPLADFLLNEGVVDKAANAGTVERSKREWAEVANGPHLSDLPRDALDRLLEEDWTLFLGMDFGMWFWGYIDFWKTQDRYVRRAWLCLALLGEAMARPGGYTANDIGDFARVKTRKPRRRVVDVLVRLGVLKRRKLKGRQPRYHYTRAVNEESAWKARNERNRTDIRRLTRGINNVLSAPGRTGTDKGWELFSFGAYVVSDPEPSKALYGVLDQAVRLFQIALARALELPLHGGEDVVARDDSFKFEQVMYAYGHLVSAAKKMDREELRDWMARVFQSGREPVFLIYLVNTMGKRSYLEEWAGGGFP
jgi:hypothetical protein